MLKSFERISDLVYFDNRKWRLQPTGQKRDIKVYNIIFPIWLLWLIPHTWILVLPLNFFFDLLVLKLAMKRYHIPNIKQNAKEVIWKVWTYGFVADFIGTAFMFVVNIVYFDYNTTFGAWWHENLVNAVSYNPFDSVFAILWVSVCVVITAFFIYLLNYKRSFRKLDIDNDEKKKLALSMAIFTAPYLFFLPTAWFF